MAELFSASRMSIFLPVYLRKRGWSEGSWWNGEGVPGQNQLHSFPHDVRGETAR